MNILIATEKPFAPAAVEGIRAIVESSGHTLRLLEKYPDKATLLSAVADVDALIIRSDLVDAAVLDAAPRLRIVVRAGAGVDNVDLDAATERDIVVMNTPGQNANAVAELVFGLLVRHVRHNYDGTAGTELRGKRIGLLAYGNVARCVARIARGFEMEVSAYDFFNRVERIEEDGTYAAHNLYDLVQQCDIVSLHTPATPRTREFVNREMVELMRPGGILINTARKEIIHEDELLQLLTERTDLSYLTDIRPDRHEDFVAALGNRYYATPKKLGAQTAEANANAGLAAARQIVGFFATGDTTFRVNR
ncbi:MAG: 3-phosphoglycerate dehydrogenase [Prevotellaceae bacterium]|nr:3-phosphoglycerate dehydrogenase [Prevotellaceae bacterium]